MTKEQDYIEYSWYKFPIEEGGIKPRCCNCGGQFEEIFVFNRQSKAPLFPSLRKFLCKNCKDDYWEKVEKR
jgi:hypothetical protein